MAGRRQSREERLKKQREYQAGYRRRMKEDKVPDRDVIAQAFLYHAVVNSLGNPKREQRLYRVLEEVEALLIGMGFDPARTRQAFNGLLDRYEDGWRFQRKVHLLPRPDEIAPADEGDGR
jgi:hypothetical protein